MSKKEKLLERFMDFSSLITYDELKHVLELFGYVEDNGGHSSGSAVSFVNKRTRRLIRMHRPHPGHEVKKYVRKAVREHLETEGYL